LYHIISVKLKYKQLDTASCAHKVYPSPEEMSLDASVLKSILSKSNNEPRIEKFEEQVDLHQIEVPAFQEWRFELTNKDLLKIKLTKGTAEIFGTELSQNYEYTFQGSLKSCVSTFSGCTLEYYNCQPSSEYVGEETCMGTFLNLHLALENKRAQGYGAPRVLVIGPKSSGKTSLCRVLVSYAEKMDRRPLYVNLNPQEPVFTISGNLTATAISGMLNLENVCLGETITTGPSFYHPKQPLVKNFGMENYRDNLKFYKYLIGQMSECIEKRLLKSADVRSSGIIVDTPAFHIGDLDVIQCIIDELKINVLIVVGNERLLVDLKRKLKYNESELTLLKVAKSSGCVDIDDKFQREIQQRAIKEYFYGISSSPLSPYTIVVNLKDFVFLNPRTLENLNLAFLSGDTAEEDSSEAGTGIESGNKSNSFKDYMERLTTPSSSNLQNAILAFADDSDLEMGKYIGSPDDSENNNNLIQTVSSRNVLGFCYVLNCDDEKGKLKLLIPSPVQHLPTKVLILTQLRYNE